MGYSPDQIAVCGVALTALESLVSAGVPCGRWLLFGYRDVLRRDGVLGLVLGMPDGLGSCGVVDGVGCCVDVVV